MNDDCEKFKNMTFLEYATIKLKYFLHGKDPENVSYEEMFRQFYDVEPAMMEVMFLYYLLQSREEFYRAKEAFDDFTGEDGFNKYFSSGNYPIFERLSNGNLELEIKREFKRDRRELDEVNDIVRNLSDEQYKVLVNNATQDYMLEKLGFPIRYGKLAQSWFAKRMKWTLPKSDELARNAMRIFAEQYNIENSELMDLLSDRTMLDKNYILSFYNGEVEMNRADISKINKALSNLRVEFMKGKRDE